MGGRQRPAQGLPVFMGPLSQVSTLAPAGLWLSTPLSCVICGFTSSS